MAYRLVGRVLAAVYQSCDKFLGSTACYFRQLAENGRVGELPTRAGRSPVLPDFSMIISHKHKFIFINTAKIAGTSIEVYLSKHCGSTDIITPIAPPIAGHQPRNYHGFINPIPEIIEAPGKFLSALRQAVTSRERFYNHMPVSEVKSRVPVQVWKNYFKFCVERNPWDKVLSHYYMRAARRGGSLSLDDYLAAGRFPVNYFRYTDAAGERIIVASQRGRGG